MGKWSMAKAHVPRSTPAGLKFVLGGDILERSLVYWRAAGTGLFVSVFC
jgi:hypothetical protein